MVEKNIALLLEELLLDEPSYFVVSIKIESGNKIMIFLDGDAGLGIDKCVQFNRRLYKMIEERNYYPEGDFSLEVSSPGIDTPLQMHRQYIKNIGRDVEVTLEDDSIKMGKLEQVTDSNIVIVTTEGKGNKATTQQHSIAYNQIKKTIIQIKF